MDNLNDNLSCGELMCGFRYGLDKIWIYTVPDTDNIGYYTGWLFVFNHTPYFYSIAQGSEGLNTYIANTYAEYLHSVGEKDCIKNIMDQDDCWGLDDDTSIEFDEAFTDAMIDAGYRQDKEGRWEYKRRKKRA